MMISVPCNSCYVERCTHVGVQPVAGTISCYQRRTLPVFSITNTVTDVDVESIKRNCPFSPRSPAFGRMAAGRLFHFQHIVLSCRDVVNLAPNQYHMSFVADGGHVTNTNAR